MPPPVHAAGGVAVSAARFRATDPEVLEGNGGTPPEVVEAETQERLSLRSGAEAVLVRGADGDTLSVRDARGRTLLVLRETDGGAVLSVEGDLELRSERGRVRIVGAEGVELQGKLISVAGERLRHAVAVLETHAGRILERARDAYREVDGLSQLRAGHLRMVARDTFRAFADRLRMKAKKDAKIDGEKIYLG